MNLDYNKICDALMPLFDPKAGAVDKSKIMAVSKAVQAFHVEPTTKGFQKKLKEKIQALGIAVSTDFAETLNQSFNAFFEMANFDLGYEQMFRLVPVSPYKRSWEIHTVANGLAFRKVAEGETIEVYGMTSTKESVTCDKYGGALGWTDELIRFREVAAMMDKAETFRNAFYVTKANAHYLLAAAAAAAHVTTWQGVNADGQLRRDIQTINKAAYDIGNKCKDKGYGDTANMPMIIYADPVFKGRLEAAFQATTAGMQTVAGKAETVMYNIRRVYTFNSNLAGKIIMVLPGFKAQRADILAPTQFTDTDILSLTYIQAVWAYYGAGVGDTEQFSELKFA